MNKVVNQDQWTLIGGSLLDAAQILAPNFSRCVVNVKVITSSLHLVQPCTTLHDVHKSTEPHHWLITPYYAFLYSVCAVPALFQHLGLGLCLLLTRGRRQTGA
jgi:hypothetical protein